jgi:hypothetical protein
MAAASLTRNGRRAARAPARGGSGTRSPIGKLSRTQGTSAREFEDRRNIGILLTPERPMTRNGGIAETVTDVPIGRTHICLMDRRAGVERRLVASSGFGRSAR